MEEFESEIKKFKNSLPKIAYVYNKFVDKAVEFIDTDYEKTEEGEKTFIKNSYSIMRCLLYVTKGIEKVDNLIREINRIERDESISEDRLEEIKKNLSQICKNPDFLPVHKDKKEEELFKSIKEMNQESKEDHFFANNINIIHYFERFRDFFKNSPEEKEEEIYEGEEELNNFQSENNKVEDG